MENSLIPSTHFDSISPHRLSKRQSLSTITVLFRTTFTWTIILNLLMKWIQDSNLSQNCKLHVPVRPKARKWHIAITHENIAWENSPHFATCIAVDRPRLGKKCEHSQFKWISEQKLTISFLSCCKRHRVTSHCSPEISHEATVTQIMGQWVTNHWWQSAQHLVLNHFTL